MERSLWAIEFFKSHLAEGMMRTLRSLVHRAEPDTREASLIKAMCLETINFLERKGVKVGERREAGGNRGGRRDEGAEG
jgi:tRNA C32,U32 (ribose-2'-O)-methylase TrmJ